MHILNFKSNLTVKMVKRKVDSENRAFQSRWEVQYMFIGGKPVYLICGDNVAVWSRNIILALKHSINVSQAVVVTWGGEHRLKHTHTPARAKILNMKHDIAGRSVI